MGGKTRSAALHVVFMVPAAGWTSICGHVLEFGFYSKSILLMVNITSGKKRKN